VSLDLPDEFDGYSHEAQFLYLETAFSGYDLRGEICDLVGMNCSQDSNRHNIYFNKAQAAKIILALGGPRGADVEIESVEEGVA